MTMTMFNKLQLKVHEKASNIKENPSENKVKI